MQHFISHLSSLISRRQGQSMLLTVLALGSTILGATTIAGLLTVYQIRQTTDMANSGKALFASDTGIEWGLYQFFKPDGTLPAPTMTNGATYQTICKNEADATIPCTDPLATSIRAVGKSANTSRALQLSF